MLQKLIPRILSLRSPTITSTSSHIRCRSNGIALILSQFSSTNSDFASQPTLSLSSLRDSRSFLAHSLAFFEKRSLRIDRTQFREGTFQRTFLATSAPMSLPIEVHNPNGRFRVVSTKPMPGTRWIDVITSAGCRLEICTSPKVILSEDDVIQLIGEKCDGVIGQLTESWGERLFAALARAGGRAYSNMAVGYNNVDVDAATKHGIAVGNTPGVLTETTAELAASLTLAAARRVVEADYFMRAGKYEGWLPTMFIGNLLKGQTVGIIGAGRIGSAYARMMVEGFKMNLIYYDLYQSKRLEQSIDSYAKHLESQGETPVTWHKASSPEEVLRVADVVSLHPVLDKTTFHLIDERRLNMMKEDAILVNCSRGPVVDEVALVEHLKTHPKFRAALDVFEDEPLMKPGLATLPNVVVVPHIASASEWTRAGMATLAASNVAGKIQGLPVWADSNNVLSFLDPEKPAPRACPSIVNAKALGLPVSAPSSRL